MKVNVTGFISATKTKVQKQCPVLKVHDAKMSNSESEKYLSDCSNENGTAIRIWKPKIKTNSVQQS